MTEKIQYFTLILIILLILGYFYKGVIIKTYRKVKTFVFSFIPNFDLIYV